MKLINYSHVLLMIRTPVLLLSLILYISQLPMFKIPSKLICCLKTNCDPVWQKRIIAFLLFQLWELITFLLIGLLQWYIHTIPHHHSTIVCESFKQISVTIMKLQTQNCVIGKAIICCCCAAFVALLFLLFQ